jgi:hypothetical protein
LLQALSIFECLGRNIVFKIKPIAERRGSEERGKQGGRGQLEMGEGIFFLIQREENNTLHFCSKIFRSIPAIFWSE